MPKNLFQRMIFALITVVITVHGYVFYSLYVINGATFMQLTGESSVIVAINAMGGVSVFGRPIPIWAVILIEFALSIPSNAYWVARAVSDWYVACLSPTACIPLFSSRR